jgi:hypothetical protein
VTSRFRAETGFANRPLALRRCLIEILSRRDRLTAHDLAGIAYGGRRLIVRPGHRRHVTSSQLVATRRALRALAAKGRIEILRRRRRWKVFMLPSEVDR